MRKLFALISRFSFNNIRIISVFSVILLLAIGANAQSRRLNDGSTPLGITPGSPAGAFSLSNFDTINPYNGNLNFRLPLINVGGRGNSDYTISLPINYRWTVWHNYDRINELYRHYPQAYRPGYSMRPSFGAGGFEIRRVRDGSGCYSGEPMVFSTLTTINFTAPDGTEYELRDQLKNGSPQTAYCGSPPDPGSSRGTVWITSDGSFITFVSDTVITDLDATLYLSGYLMFPDGRRYRIDNSKVSWIRDRDGNLTTFTYDGWRLIKVIDSIGREITFAYDVQDADQYGLHDQITYKGFSGETRTIRISYKSLDEILRSDYTIQTYNALFGLDDMGATQHNPTNVVAAVWLPNGQSYRFYYNSYNELARVELPTGGAFEYDWGASLLNGSATGIVDVQTTANQATWGFPEIYRRVLTRRVYPDGGTGNSFTIRTTFRQTEGQGTTNSDTIVSNYDSSGNLLTQQKHYFYGNPIPLEAPDVFFRPAWNEGKESQTEVFDIVNGTSVLKRRVNQTWQNGIGSGYNQGNARIIEAVTRLIDTNQVAKTTAVSPVDGSIGFDQFNNPIDVWEYDYGTDAAGAFKRRTHTDYLSDANYISHTGAHLRGLPTESWVSSDINGANKVSKTEFKYDEMVLTPRENVIGWTNPTNPYRGNLTKTRSWVKYGSEPEDWLETKAEYDVLGNIVKTIDAKNNTSLIDYADRFGTANGEARGNWDSISAPSQLNGLSTFAFPTSATNALNWTTGYSQFDYYTGQPVDVEDLNGVVNSTFYNDPLDRPTQIIAANNLLGFKRQTTIIYDDDEDRRVEIKTDLNAFNDNLIKSESFYDGLGRTVESRRYESDGNFIATKSIPFVMVQDPETSVWRAAAKASNPYRPSAGEQPVWTTSLSDSLGRAIKVITPDGAIAKTEYSGNAVTATDQAGKQRRSITNALGQLKEVHEPNNAGQLGSIASPNQPTYYSYDTLNNLLQVEQIGTNAEQCGGTTTNCTQIRTFEYDSLSRLKSAANPESGLIK